MWTRAGDRLRWLQRFSIVSRGALPDPESVIYIFRIILRTRDVQGHNPLIYSTCHVLGMSTTTLDLREIKAALYDGLFFNTLASLKEKTEKTDRCKYAYWLHHAFNSWHTCKKEDTLARRKTHMLARARCTWPRQTQAERQTNTEHMLLPQWSVTSQARNTVLNEQLSSAE